MSSIQPISSKKVPLVINTLSRDKYLELSANGQIDPNQIYQFTDRRVNGFGYRAINIATPVLSSDAANKMYVDEAVTNINQFGSNLYSLKTLNPVSLLSYSPYESQDGVLYLCPECNTINKLVVDKTMKTEYDIIMPKKLSILGIQKSRDFILHVSGLVENAQIEFVSSNIEGNPVKFAIDESDDLSDVVDTSSNEDFYLSFTEVDESVFQVSRRKLKMV